MHDGPFNVQQRPSQLILMLPACCECTAVHAYGKRCTVLVCIHAQTKNHTASRRRLSHARVFEVTDVEPAIREGRKRGLAIGPTSLPASAREPQPPPDPSTSTSPATRRPLPHIRNARPQTPPHMAAVLLASCRPSRSSSYLLCAHRPHRRSRRFAPSSDRRVGTHTSVRQTTSIEGCCRMCHAR